MIAAIAAGLLVTALTFGAAGPIVAGALGALAAAEATILTKLAFKGSAYSNEELLVDVVSGAVDVVFAVLTAGVGNALMRVAKGVPIGPLAKLATSASRSKRMIAHGLANGVEGFLSGIPSAAAGSLVDEKTWTQGDPLTNFVTATGMGARDRRPDGRRDGVGRRVEQGRGPRSPPRSRPPARPRGRRSGVRSGTGARDHGRPRRRGPGSGTPTRQRTPAPSTPTSSPTSKPAGSCPDPAAAHGFRQRRARTARRRTARV